MKAYNFKSNLGNVSMPDVLFDKTSKLWFIITSEKEENQPRALDEITRLGIDYHKDIVRYNISKNLPNKPSEDDLFYSNLEEDLLWLKLARVIYNNSLPEGYESESARLIEIKKSSKEDRLDILKMMSDQKRKLSDDKEMKEVFENAYRKMTDFEKKIGNEIKQFDNFDINEIDSLIKYFSGEAKPQESEVLYENKE